MDGQMSEEIRLGVLVLHALRGRGYRRKDGTGPSMSFSSTLIDIAGGFLKFIAEWEEDPKW